MVQYFNLAVLFWRFPVLHFLAVPLSAVPGTAKYDGNFLTVMKYGGNFLAVMKYGDQMGCQTTYLWCAIKWRASFLFLSEPVVMYLSFKCNYATHRQIEQPNAKRNLKRKDETNGKRGVLKH